MDVTINIVLLVLIIITTFAIIIMFTLWLFGRGPK